MFERFTDRARRVIVLTQEEARLDNSPLIPSEYILLGLIHEGEGVAAQVLDALGFTLAGLRVAAHLPSFEKPTTGHIPFTDAAKDVLEGSLREALQLGHNYVGTEHILLGWLRSTHTNKTLIDNKVNEVRLAVLDALRGVTVSSAKLAAIDTEPEDIVLALNTIDVHGDNVTFSMSFDTWVKLDRPLSLSFKEDT